MSLNLDLTQTLLSSLIGSLGFVLFVYGKKTASWKPLVAGVCLFALPFLAADKLGLIAGTLLTLSTLYVFRE